MRPRIAIATLLMLWTAKVLAAAEPLGPGDHTLSLAVGGLQRSAIVHVPPQYDRTVAMPVVLAFHGGGANADTMVRFSGLNDKADEAGFIAVYPNGTGRLQRMLTFNGGNCCGQAAANGVDDVEFTRRLLDDVAGACSIDSKRVFATGMSNGGIMAYRLASELSERIAAIAPVGGPMGTKGCRPGRPVSVIHFHGTDDAFAPFQGGRGRGLSGTSFFSVDHSIAAWVEADGCDPNPVTIRLPDTTDDGTTVTRTTYGQGKDGAEVVLIVIEGGGHTWPGREPRLASLGKSTRDISANDLTWEFFQRHPLP
jgi:polyhydroxybutyrate depolymerase